MNDLRVVKLTMALQLIADSHLPDMPAAMGENQYQYALNHIARLRRYATQVLKDMSQIQHASDCALHGVDTGIKSDKWPDGISYDGPCDCGAGPSDDGRVFWLIEGPGADTRYWSGNKDGWITDHNKAIQFSRKEDAEAFIYGTWLDLSRPVEHAYISGRPMAKATGDAS